jgi:hypothetical protein
MVTARDGVGLMTLLFVGGYGTMRATQAGRRKLGRRGRARFEIEKFDDYEGLLLAAPAPDWSHWTWTEVVTAGSDDAVVGGYGADCASWPGD